MDKIWESFAYQRRDLTNCESEPIQFCGAIQSAGWFLSVDRSTGRIQAASENFKDLLQADTLPLEQSLEDVLSFTDGEPFSVSSALKKSLAGTIPVQIKKTQTILSAHFSKGQEQICVDLEPILPDSKLTPTQFIESLRSLVFQVDLEATLESMLQRASEHLRLLTGFDRLMIYRFDSNWDGQVIAESVKDGYEQFLGLHYPASDIPAQARSLYLNSHYRMIVDVNSDPVPVLTSPGLGRAEIDLSCSALRAASPFHIQYLKNMKVRSSFSVPLKVNGALWGLISCHYYEEAKLLSREMRSSCELAAQVISGRIVDQITDRRLRIRTDILLLSQSILDSVTEGQSAVQAFKANSENLMSATESQGLYVQLGGEHFCAGDTPSLEYIQSLAHKLQSNVDSSLVKVESAQTEMNLPFDEKCVGFMAVPLSFGFEDLLIWFRPEAARLVNWGGNPHLKQNTKEVLSPRASFKMWTEKVLGKSKPWSEAAQESAQNILFTFVRGIFKKARELAKANEELSRVTRAKDEFIGMVSHELRTPLGVMIGWIDIMKDDITESNPHRQALDIIDRNAKLQINLINDLLDVSRIISGKMRIAPQKDVFLQDLVTKVLEDLQPTADTKDIRILFQRQDDIHAPMDPDRMRQIIWNIVSNSIKFTQRSGEILVRVQKRPTSYHIDVTDTGIGIESENLSRIFDRFSQVQEGRSRTGGLGLGLSIVKALVELHGGQVSVHSAGKNKGTTFKLSFPLYELKTEETFLKTSLHQKSEPTYLNLHGVRILIAEDQTEAAAALAFTMKKWGAELTLVHDGVSALQALEKQRFDLILSDIAMPEMDGIELLKKFRQIETQRGSAPTPAIALTAYATSKDRINCLEAGYQSHLPKPVDRTELLAVIKSLGFGINGVPL